MYEVKHNRKFLHCIAPPLEFVIPDFVSLYMGCVLISLIDILSGLRGLMLISDYAFTYSIGNFVH